MTRVLGAGDVEVVLDAHAQVGECPVWDRSRGELLWVDIPRHTVHRFRPCGGRRSAVDVGQPVGAVAVRATGGLVLAVRDGFALLDDDAAPVRLVAEVERDRPGNRMNDGRCDAAGRFWAGTMALDMAPGAGALYRLDPDLTVERVLAPTSVSNGLGWSADGRTMYFVDSATGGVDAFDHASGSLRGRRRLIEVPVGTLPDGMAIDADGFLWVALWNGWCVHRYSPDGVLDTVVELPAAQITSCTFGGGDLDELYVTSAAAGLSPRERAAQPHAGAIFRVRPGVRGLPADLFAG